MEWLWWTESEAKSPVQKTSSSLSSESSSRAVVELGFEERTGGEGKEARKRSEEGELRWRKREEGRLRSMGMNE